LEGEAGGLLYTVVAIDANTNKSWGAKATAAAGAGGKPGGRRKSRYS
jgi:hypothetical protein